jgi:uncharacterized protein
MWKKFCFFLTFFVSACVTVNIYFPAAAVQRAADKIVEETWGESGESGRTEPPRSSNPARQSTLASFSVLSVAFAQEADINVSNPAIRALKESIKTRSDSIKPFMDRGHVGISQDGLLTIRGTEGLNLRQRAEIQQLVEAENRDREALYSEIAKANNISRESVPKIKRIFAKSWIDQARSGWWVQDAQGNWSKK